MVKKLSNFYFCILKSCIFEKAFFQIKNLNSLEIQGFIELARMPYLKKKMLNNLVKLDFCCCHCFYVHFIFKNNLIIGSKAFLSLLIENVFVLISVKQISQKIFVSR